MRPIKRFVPAAVVALLLMAVAPALSAPGEPEQAGLPADPNWTTFVEPEFGTRVDVPSSLFSVDDGPSFRGVGQQFSTPDGRAVLAIYSQSNERGDTPASYRKKNFKGSHAAVDYDRVTRDFFALAGTSDGTIYYSRCNFSRRDGGTIHCFDVKYPQREKRAWDAIVTRMSLSLKGP
jgi:hypothetical protein